MRGSILASVPSDSIAGPRRKGRRWLMLFYLFTLLPFYFLYIKC
nr:MAG TPA: hypothetical protein [Caudoviricetes sp.]